VPVGKLLGFDFARRIYVPMREIWVRNKQELKAGRPPIPRGKRIKAQLKAALAHDSLQMRHGGFQGPYQRKVHREQKAAWRAKEKEFWNAVKGALKK